MKDDDRPQKGDEPPSGGVSRREIFHVLGSVPVIAAVTPGSGVAQTRDDHPHGSHADAGGASQGPYEPKVFDDHQWRTVHVLCDLIIPADERSGSATQAGVPQFIDDWLDFRKREDGHDNLAAQILGGLAWLDRESMRLFDKIFADAAAGQQEQILDRIAWPERAAPADHPWVSFFNTFRDLTVSGFFSSKIGIADLPYLGNQAVAEWKGCDPQVWAKIEARMRNGYQGLGGAVKPWTD